MPRALCGRACRRGWPASRAGRFGSGLDVYPDEPFARMDEAGQYEVAALAREPTVVLSHHTAGLKKEAEARITARIVEEAGKLAL